MSNFAQELSNLQRGIPGAILAPMAGITDAGMRAVAARYGATYTVSEMVDGRFLASGEPMCLARMRGTSANIVQIAGCTAASMAETARFAEGVGAEAIDINMGCPSRKVVGGAAGSALMRDLDHATALLSATRAAVGVPVTLKMRLGWDDGSRNAPELARRAEAEGIALVTVHGRTRCQFYSGDADWAAIRAVVEAVSIPVVANGDCRDLAAARTMLAVSGAAAVMIGRAAIGRPWLVGDIAHALRTGRERSPPTSAERCACALQQYAAVLSLHGVASGVRHARKHLAGYAIDAGHAPGSAPYQALVTQADPDDIVRQLEALYDATPGQIVLQAKAA